MSFFLMKFTRQSKNKVRMRCSTFPFREKTPKIIRYFVQPIYFKLFSTSAESHVSLREEVAKASPLYLATCSNSRIFLPRLFGVSFPKRMLRFWMRFSFVFFLIGDCFITLSRTVEASLILPKYTFVTARLLHAKTNTFLWHHYACFHCFIFIHLQYSHN